MGASARLLFGALLVAMAAGCPFSFTNEDHCAAQDGDASCAGSDAARPYCALDGCGLYDEVDNRSGCVAELPTDMSCYSPCGGKQDANARSDCGSPGTGSTSTSTGTVSTSSDGSTEGGPSSSVTGECGCDADAPICFEGGCVACELDADCEILADESRPFCDAGDCVACRPQQDGTSARHIGCSGETPNCEQGDCVAKCLFPDDCPQTGCDFFEGFCAPMETRFFVSSTGGNDDGAGNETDPLATIGEALERIGPARSQAETRVGTILLLPGTYSETVNFGGRTVILRPADPDAAPPVFAIPAPRKGQDVVPVFTLVGVQDVGGGVLSISGIRVEESPGPVVFIETTASFYGDDLELVGNDSVIRSDGGTGFLRNSVVRDSVQTPFVFLQSSELALEATTVIETNATELFDCTTGEDSRVTLRHSIAGNLSEPAPVLAVGACTWVDGGAVDSTVGLLPSPTSFRAESDYRLDNDAIEDYEAGDVVYCEPGVAEAPEGFLIPCAPTRDIDGKSRVVANWRGFSVR